MRARICALAMGCVLPMLAPASLAGAPDFVLGALGGLGLAGLSRRRVASR